MSLMDTYMKGVVKFLVLNKEKIYTISELYTELDKNYPEYNLRRQQNLKYFKLAIYNIDEEYENIHKVLINNIYNIIYSLKTKTEIQNIYSKRVYFQNVNELDFSYIEIVESILEDRLSKEREKYFLELLEKEKMIKKKEEVYNNLQESYMTFHIMTVIVLFIFTITYLFKNPILITLINGFQIFINILLSDTRRKKSIAFYEDKFD